MTILVNQPDVKAPIRGRGRRLPQDFVNLIDPEEDEDSEPSDSDGAEDREDSEPSDSEDTVIEGPVVNYNGGSQVSLIPQRPICAISGPEPRVLELPEPQYSLDNPEQVAQDFLRTTVLGESVWDFIRTLKRSMRWSGQLILIDTFKRVIAALNSSQVYYFLTMEEVSGYSAYFLRGSNLDIDGHIRSLPLTPLIFSLSTAPARMHFLNRVKPVDFLYGTFVANLGFTLDQYILVMRKGEISTFLEQCEDIWLNFYDTRIFFLTCSRVAFYGIHEWFGAVVMGHFNRGVDITRFWTIPQVSDQELASYVEIFKFSTFGQNKHILSFLRNLCPDAFIRKY